MHRNWTYRSVLTSGLVAALAHAQQGRVNGIRIDGTITDPTGAVISGVQVRATDGETATTDTADRIPLSRMSYLLHCFRMSEARTAMEAWRPVMNGLLIFIMSLNVLAQNATIPLKGQ